MKISTILLTTFLVVMGGITIAAFSVKEFKNNAFAVKCFYYNLATTLDNLDPYVPSTYVPLAQFSTFANWTVHTGVPVPIPCPGGVQICWICFDDSFITATRTFTDLFTALHQQITLSGLPVNGETYNLFVEGASIQFQVFLEPNS